MEPQSTPDLLEQHGFVRLAAIKHAAAIGDVATNVERSVELAEQMEFDGVDVAVFPELNLTSYTCGDMFFDQTLQGDAMQGISNFAKATRNMRPTFVLGAPVAAGSDMYNAAAVIRGGEIKGIVPKLHLPNYGEFYEARWFRSGKGIDRSVRIGNQYVRLTAKQVFDINNLATLGVEICEDMWVPKAPNIALARSDANIIANLSASNEVIGKHPYRRDLITSTSGRLLCSYVFSSAGIEESTADVVMGGATAIAANGAMLAEGERFVRGSNWIEADVDITHLMHDRRKSTTFTSKKKPYMHVPAFGPTAERTELLVKPKAHPFVPSDPEKRTERCAEIIEQQANGLATRLEKMPPQYRKVVLGLSGGLDSTLALLVAKRAFEILDLPMSDIHTIGLPSKHSSDRTQDNATLLAEALGTTHTIIPIGEQATNMLRAVGHGGTEQDLAYENTFARTRTETLFAYSAEIDGLVLGTGDLSELALGWCTYNGDHMSQYNVNCTIPKTLVRYLVANAAEQIEAEDARAVLADILDTPVSPELKDDQNTEDELGPYELHDFFLYNFNRFGDKLDKIAVMADKAFEGEYDPLFIRKTMRTFVQKWFTSQWKRNVATDGPKVGTVAFSPRGDLRMPPEASMRAYLERVEAEIAVLEALAEVQ